MTAPDRSPKLHSLPHSPHSPMHPITCPIAPASQCPVSQITHLPHQPLSPCMPDCPHKPDHLLPHTVAPCLLACLLDHLPNCQPPAQSSTHPSIPDHPHQRDHLNYLVHPQSSKWYLPICLKVLLSYKAISTKSLLCPQNCVVRMAGFI